MYRRYILFALAWVVAAHFPATTMADVQVGRRPAAESSVSASGGSTWRVRLSARDRWFDTGIIISGGTTVNISATGTITWAPPGWNTPSTVGPRGTRPPYDEDKSRFPMPDAGCGSLIMRVGGSVYFVGDHTSMRVTESGTIQLMVNDDVLTDNSGAFYVSIEIPGKHDPGGGGRPALALPAAAENSQSPVRVIEIPADRMWINTGVQVSAGDLIMVESSGRVNGSVRGNDANGWVGPEGWSPPPVVPSYSKVAWVLGKGSAYMCLTGKIGEDGTAFKVGSNSSFEARSGGALYLGINDELIDENGYRVTDDGLGWRDNAGSFQARISVSARSGGSGLRAELSGLRQSILDKIDNDVESVALGFTNSEAIMRDLRVAYTFKTVLDTLTGTLGIISEAASVGKLKTSVMGVASPIEFSGSMMAIHGAYSNGETLAFVFDKNRYTSGVGQMLKSADATQPAFGFDPARYTNSIKQTLYSAGGASIAVMPHRPPREPCQAVQVRGPNPIRLTSVKGLVELRGYISSEFQKLEEYVAGREFTPQQANELADLIRSAKRSVVVSKSRPTAVSLATPTSLLPPSCRPAQTEISLGRIAADQTVLTAAYDALDKGLRLEQTMTVKSVGDGIISGVQIYTKGQGGRVLQTVLDVSSKTSPAIDVGNLVVSKTFSSKPEEVIAEKPHEMLLAMPEEGSSLLLLTDTMGRIIRQAGANSPPARRESRFSVRTFNVDDTARVYVNGVAVSEVRYGGTGAIDITGMLRRGSNQVRLTLENYQEGYAYGFEIYQDGRSVFKEECGQVNVSGCRGSERAGVVYERTATIRVDENDYSFNPGSLGSTGRDTQDQGSVLEVERVGPGRTPDEKMYQFTVPANRWVETGIRIKPNQEVMIHHFLSSERVTIKLGGLTDSRLQQPGTILPLYTSRNCSSDPGVRARVQYTCVQLDGPEGVKLFARQSVTVGIYIKDR